MEIVHLNNTIEKPRPEKSDIVLLLVDVINDFDLEDSDKLLRFALPVAKQIAALKKRAVAQGIPVIYVNDNFGHWHSNLNAQVEHCRQSNTNSKCVAANTEDLNNHALAQLGDLLKANTRPSTKLEL